MIEESTFLKIKMNSNICDDCKKNYKSKSSLVRHCNSKKHAIHDDAPCKIIKKYCDKCRVDVLDLIAHCKSTKHKNNEAIKISDQVDKITSAFKNRISSYRIKNTIPSDLIIENFFKSIEKIILDLINQYLINHEALKINIELFGNFDQSDIPGTEMKSFLAPARAFYKGDDVLQLLLEMIQYIGKLLEDFEEHGSGWTLNVINYLEININKLGNSM